MYVIPSHTYSYETVSWCEADLDSWERIIRTKATRARTHHKNPSFEPFLLPKNKGGAGITNIHNTTFTTSTLRHYEISFTISKTTPTYVKLYVVPTFIDTPLNLYDPLPQHNKNIKTIQERTTRNSRALHGRNAYNLKKPMSIERHRTHG